MKTDKINEIIEVYGLDRILEDNHITLSECLDILEELGFINLSMYDPDVDCNLPDSD